MSYIYVCCHFSSHRLFLSNLRCLLCCVQLRNYIRTLCSDWFIAPGRRGSQWKQTRSVDTSKHIDECQHQCLIEIVWANWAEQDRCGAVNDWSTTLLGVIAAVIRTRPCAAPPLHWVWIGAACSWIEPPQGPSTSRTLWKGPSSTQRERELNTVLCDFKLFSEPLLLGMHQYFGRHT